MRLIDAEELKNEIVKICKCQPYLEGRQEQTVYIKDIVDNQPTAYDVDKVVEQLESLEPFHVDGYGDVMVNCDDVIEIVKRS